MRFAHGHLAYCTNIHPAEDWSSTFQAISTHAMKVRELVAPEDAFAIGLRLSANAAAELLRGDTLPEALGLAWAGLKTRRSASI